MYTHDVFMIFSLTCSGILGMMHEMLQQRNIDTCIQYITEVWWMSPDKASAHWSTTASESVHATLHAELCSGFDVMDHRLERGVCGSGFDMLPM